MTFAAQFTLAQTPELRDVPNNFKSEAGCPVEVVSAKTVLEIDPVGMPMACRVYIDYKNVSAKSLAGVRFRIGYVDAEEQVKGTFHAPDGSQLAPGAQGHGKWRGERVDPRTKSVIIRGLMARFSDGSIWESEKSEGGVIKPTPQPGQEGYKPFGAGAGSGALAQPSEGAVATPLPALTPSSSPAELTPSPATAGAAAPDNASPAPPAGKDAFDSY